MKPFFSIIIPTYNRAHTLQRALDSVFNQSFQDFEVIVVDDGSEDQTQSLLTQYNIRSFYQGNSGVSKARNLAASYAQGEWLCFLDSDDEWLKDKLLHQYNSIKEKEDVFLFHTEELWVRNGQRVNQMLKHKKGDDNLLIRSFKLCLISPSTACIKKEIFDSLEGFREDFPCCEDYDLWLRYLAQYKSFFIKTPLIKKYGGHDDQLSRKYVAMDYYRVKSMADLFDNYSLCDKTQESLRSVLLKKCRVLLKGYKKHQNMKYFSEIEGIYKKFLQGV